MLSPLLDATDAAIVGRFGSVLDLAALSPSMAACYIIGLLFTFLSATTANSLARARGRGDYQAARSVLSDACCLAVCCGAVVGGGIILACRGVLGVLISPAALAAVAAPASAYIHIRALAFPAQLLQMVLSAACFAGLQDTSTPLLASALGGLANLLVDLVLVAGCGLGCAGAAIGTVSGQLLATCVLARALRRSRGFGAAGEDPQAAPLLSTPASWLESLRPSRMLPLLAFAAPFLYFQLMKVLLMTFETRMGSAFGERSLAAHQITYSLWRFLILLCDPIMQAAQALVPGPYASKSPHGVARARSLGQAILAVSLALGVGSAGLGASLSLCAPALFTADAAVAREAAGLAAPMVASILSLCVWHVNEGLMLGTGRARLLAMLYTWNVFYFVTGSRYVLDHGLGLYHSWWVFASMHTIFSAIVSVVLRMPGGLFWTPPHPRVQTQGAAAPALPSAARKG